MSINIRVALDQVWSINEQGFFELDVITLPSLGDEIVGPLVLTTTAVMATLEKEIIAASEYDLQFDHADWVNLRDQLWDMADSIETRLGQLQ